MVKRICRNESVPSEVLVKLMKFTDRIDDTYYKKPNLTYFTYFHLALVTLWIPANKLSIELNGEFNELFSQTKPFY